MTTATQKLEDGTIELTVTIPWSTIATAYDAVVDQKVKDVELPGFRKGKAPKELAEKKLDKSALYEDVVRSLIPAIYNEAITNQKLRPIVTPQVELKEAVEQKDWVIRLVTCEKPEIKLGEYKKAVREAKAQKDKKIWVPGQEPPKEEKPEAEKKASLDHLLKALYESVTITMPKILLDHEVNRLLSELIDQTKKLGLTVEQYLASTNRNSQTVRAEYEQQAKRTLTLEFALEEIADKEGILVSDDELSTVIKGAKTDEERRALEKDRYYLATILRRQKTLDFLASL